MGLLEKLFGTTPEAFEISTMRKSMLQIKAHGGAYAMLEEFTTNLRETREPAGYRGFLVENEYMPRIAGKACALMILSEIKKRLLIKGASSESDLGRIKAAPEYAKAHALYIDADEVITQATFNELRAKQLDDAKELLGKIGEPGTRELIQKSPYRTYVTALKEKSEKDWERWLYTASRMHV